MKTARRKSDPRHGHADAVLTEIVRNGVIAVTEEMKTNLMRTAYNMIVYEALDFTVGLYTPQGDTISIGLGLPSFIRGMAETVKAKLAHFARIGPGDGLEPGDILVTNDAYTTGSHLYHFTFSLPIYHRGKLSGFACCMAHWTDVGGVLGGVTTDIYSEGLQIPILKYARAGVVNQDLKAHLAALGFGFNYVPDPGSQVVSTIGGNVGNNAGGMHCLKYGVTSNHVLGVEVVLSSGHRIRVEPGFDAETLARVLRVLEAEAPC